MKTLIKIMLLLFIFGTADLQAKPKSQARRHKSLITYYRSAKFKKKAHKRTQRNYKHACKYHNHFKEYKFGYRRYGERKHNFNFIKKLNFIKKK